LEILSDFTGATAENCANCRVAMTDLVALLYVQKHLSVTSSQGYHACHTGTSLCLQAINAGYFVAFRRAADLLVCLNLQNLSQSNAME
jgi:hypothetical protein